MTKKSKTFKFLEYFDEDIFYRKQPREMHLTKLFGLIHNALKKKNINTYLDVRWGDFMVFLNLELLEGHLANWTFFDEKISMTFRQEKEQLLKIATKNYQQRGLTYDDISQLLSIPVVTLKRKSTAFKRTSKKKPVIFKTESVIDWYVNQKLIPLPPNPRDKEITFLWRYIFLPEFWGATKVPKLKSDNLRTQDLLMPVRVAMPSILEKRLKRFTPTQINTLSGMLIAGLYVEDNPEDIKEFHNNIHDIITENHHYILIKKKGPVGAYKEENDTLDLLQKIKSIAPEFAGCPDCNSKQFISAQTRHLGGSEMWFKNEKKDSPADCNVGYEHANKYVCLRCDRTFTYVGEEVDVDYRRKIAIIRKEVKFYMKNVLKQKIYRGHSSQIQSLRDNIIQRYCNNSGLPIPRRDGDVLQTARLGRPEPDMDRVARQLEKEREGIDEKYAKRYKRALEYLANLNMEREFFRYYCSERDRFYRGVHSEKGKLNKNVIGMVLGITPQAVTERFNLGNIKKKELNECIHIFYQLKVMAQQVCNDCNPFMLVIVFPKTFGEFLSQGLITVYPHLKNEARGQI